MRERQSMEHHKFLKVSHVYNSQYSHTSTSNHLGQLSFPTALTGIITDQNSSIRKQGGLHG